MPDVEPVESEDTGLSVWVLVAVVVAILALLSVPAYYGIRTVLDADWNLSNPFDSQPDEGTAPGAQAAPGPETDPGPRDLSPAGVSITLPEGWVVFPLYDSTTQAESYRRAEEDWGGDSVDFLESQVTFIESQSGIRVVVAWDTESNTWLTIGRWQASENDHPGYVMDDMKAFAAANGGSVDEFDPDFPLAGVRGVRGVLTAPVPDGTLDIEQAWYVVWTEQYAFRLIFTYDQSDGDRASVDQMVETVGFPGEGT